MASGSGSQDNVSQAGVLHLNQAGVTSRANVTGEGRVDISFSQNAANVTRILAEAIKSRSIKEDSGTWPGYGRTVDSIHQSDDRPSLILNVVIQIVGSRGDVQPFIAIAQVLKKKYGHRVRVATHPVFKEFVEQNELEFFSIGGDPSELMAFMVKNPGLMPGQQALKEGQVGLRRKSMMEIMQRCWRSCYETGNGEDAKNPALGNSKPFIADAIIANPPSFAHIHCAERLGVPLHMVFTMPWSPTQQFPHPLSNMKSAEMDFAFACSLTYTVVELLTWQGLGDLVNSFREITLGLAPLTTLSGPSSLHRLRVPYSYCWSPALIPKPRDWGENIEVCGFSFLDQKTDYEPSEDLKTFLSEGELPVYVGFGSIVVDDPSALTSIIIDAVKRTGQRALVSKGWGGIGSNAISLPSSIFLLGNVPHDWLFQHVSCVVHHGGAGTTAAGIAAGKPTVIVPFFGDQPFWGDMVFRAGAGPMPIPYIKLTAEKLADAITEALTTSVVAKARQLSGIISQEDGSVATAEHFQAVAERQHDSCSIIRGQKAVWKTRTTGIPLSPSAASLLLSEKKLSIEDLDLHRTCNYPLATGPLDPFSAGATALMGTIGSLMGGISDIPPDVFIHLREATKKESNSDLDHDTSDDLDPAGISFASADSRARALASTVDASKGAARIIGAGLKSPKDFTLALAKGFHSAPRLYGDDTVREQPNVTGVASGIKAATSGLGYGFMDGIAGLVRHPVKGLQQEGLDGFAKGIGKAIGGIVLKPAAGIWGVPGYISEGVWQGIRRRIATSSDAQIIAGRILEGEDDLLHIDAASRVNYLRKWHEIGKTRSKSGSDSRKAERQTYLAKPEHFDEDVTAAINSVSGGISTRQNELVSAAIESHLLRTNGRVLFPSDMVHGDVFDIDQKSDKTNISHTITDSARSTKRLLPGVRDDPEVNSDDDENIKEALRQSLQRF